MTIAGVAFDIHRLDEVGLAGWPLLTAAGLPEGVATCYLDAEFVSLVQGLGSSIEFGTISRWPLLAPEFGWPLSAGSCGCLTDHRLSDTARALSGESLFRVPGTVFDHFLIRMELLALAVDLDAVDASVGAAGWLERVGVENSWVTAGHLDASPRSTLLRDALCRVNTPWLHDSFVRALDAYASGGSAHAAAEALRRAFIHRLLEENGHTYGRAQASDVVRRELFSLNSVRMTESVCCTTVEHAGRPVFATAMERVAQSTEVVAEAK